MKRPAALLLVFLLPIRAEAAGPPLPADHGDSGLDFSLYLARSKAPLDYAGRRQDTISRQLGLNLRERVGRRVTLGLYAGYSWLTQTGNPVTAGAELGGYHAGLTLHGVLLEGRGALLYGVLDYGYLKVDDNNDTRQVVIEWVQPQAQLGILLTLSERWRLYGGGSYGKLDGEERARGAVNHTLGFERGARSGGFVGLDLNVETDGYVGVEVRSGVTRGGEIYFKRRF